METLPGHLERLPEGQDRFQAELMSRSQRERILAAAAEVIAARGYQGATVALIVARAGVARVTFYENFENREACLLALFDEAFEETRRRTEAAISSTSDWPGQVRACIAAFLEYVVEEPAIARACLIESMTAGPAAMQRYERALRAYSPILRQGRELAGGPDGLPGTLLEDSIVGGIVWMVHQRLLRGELEEIPALLPTMTEFALGPYLGEERAAAIAAS
jgi:AcrR family transcriptional regulator